MKILKLTLTKKPFDLMAVGLKRVEIRRPSQWIKSRLINKEGKPKKYALIEFTNGYGKDKPKFYCKYMGFGVAKDNDIIRFGYNINGLDVQINKGDYIIVLGPIIEIKNAKILVERGFISPGINLINSVVATPQP